MMTPVQVVQAQLDAYNAHDVEALCRIYASDAGQYQHPDTLLAAGSAAIRERFAARFAAASPRAELLHRIVTGRTVIDHEKVHSLGAEGPGYVELVAMYEVKEERIANAWFIFGAKTQLRTATVADVATLEALIARSGLGLSQGFYTEEQAAALTEHVYGVDTQLIEDRTYFIVERDGAAIAAGGWSKRATLCGADKAKGPDDPELDPALQPGRIRAFFVDPGHPRQGLATLLLRHCEDAARAAGFSALELAATMPGVPFYRAAGYDSIERFKMTPGGVEVPLARMRKTIA
ncbi:GNAT family N-acetyltransferase [Pseudoduganella buxea]|nr:GNAT family N-acetyltransferase [Pseudoduganella buxea]